MPFINWIFTDNKKIPTSPTGRYIDPHDPQYHMATYEEAAQYGQVGMVLTDKDDFFFIDIDKCYSAESGWSPLALDMCNRFRGCFIEVSRSGTGLHIIGRGRVDPTLTCKCGEFDLFRSKRFIALTMLNPEGDMSFWAQSQMDQMIADYKITKPKSACVDVELRDTPVDEYTGKWELKDIPSVIMRKEMSRPEKAFGKIAPFKALWEGDEGVLSKHYPSSSDSVFDRSSADLALCTTLCFWTGNNHAAVDELFRESGLMREKWEKRADYRTTTLKLATSEKVYSVVKGSNSLDELDPGVPFKTIDEMSRMFSDHVYVANINRVFDPKGNLFLDQGRFNAMYGGCVYCMDAQNTVINTTAWSIVTKCQVEVIKKAYRICFKPKGELGVNEGTFNTYMPYTTPVMDGDVTPFLEHIKFLFPQEVDQLILLNYMAAVVQYPGTKFQWAPVIQGVEGNGKSLFNVVLSRCVGPDYSILISGDRFNSKFNGWLMNKIFVGVEEFASSDKFDVLERIKPVITNEQIEIEQKGVESFPYDNYANFLFNTNHKGAVRKSINDRRYCVMYSAQQSKEELAPMKYYSDLWKWLRDEDGFAKINSFLLHHDIPDEYNPAGGLINAPRSSVHDEVIYESLTKNETAVVEAVDEELIGFRGGIISSQRVRELLQCSGKRAGQILTALGYKKICRSSKCIVQEGNSKPYFWIKKDDDREVNNIAGLYESLNYSQMPR